MSTMLSPPDPPLREPLSSPPTRWSPLAGRLGPPPPPPPRGFFPFPLAVCPPPRRTPPPNKNPVCLKSIAFETANVRRGRHPDVPFSLSSKRVDYQVSRHSLHFAFLALCHVMIFRCKGRVSVSSPVANRCGCHCGGAGAMRGGSLAG